jgi:hypothetical protein
MTAMKQKIAASEKMTLDYYALLVTIPVERIYFHIV